MKSVNKIVREARENGRTFIGATPLSVVRLSKIGQLHCASDQLSLEKMHDVESWGLVWATASRCDNAESRM